MLEQDLNKELNRLVHVARDQGLEVTIPTLFIDKVFGSKLAYYQLSANKIVIDEHYSANGSDAEVLNTLIHEFAHAVAEQNNKEVRKNGKIKHVWHGQAWKDINSALGGDSERYHAGAYKKPEHKKKTMAELYAVQPVHPASRWERGTYKQWLERGYHVIKGQKGQFTTWEFVGDEYETETDGTSKNGYGRASAVYFDADQVEANQKGGN